MNCNERTLRTSSGQKERKTKSWLQGLVECTASSTCIMSLSWLKEFNIVRKLCLHQSKLGVVGLLGYIQVLKYLFLLSRSNSLCCVCICIIPFLEHYVIIWRWYTSIGPSSDPLHHCYLQMQLDTLLSFWWTLINCNR